MATAHDLVAQARELLDQAKQILDNVEEQLQLPGASHPRGEHGTRP
ncbi:hypothetical protein [Hyperthermus butylicus]|nr:hypothetical protein [Hyperthermus butylicus]